MPTPPLKREAVEDAVSRVEQKLREGYRPAGMTGSHGPGAIDAAFEQAAMDGAANSREGFRARLNRGKELFGLEPDWSLYRPARYQQPVARQVIERGLPPEPVLLTPHGPAERVLVIGDLHQDPRHENRLDVLTWIARHASATRPDRIIQIGDWSTWDSCSAHDRNDTRKGHLKPSIKQDLENLQASLRAWRLGIDEGWRPKATMLMGNHEYRVERFENATPEAYGIHTLARDETFLQFGWQTRPYGELYYVQGVAFTHHPINGAGRAFGGKTGPQRAANDSLVPIVSGHTHRRQVHDCPKIGGAGLVSMVEVGCAMPWGEVEEYAAHSPTGWFWGVCELTVQAGAIIDVNFLSMLTLRSKYEGRNAVA